jgi:hypothetical protein
VATLVGVVALNALSVSRWVRGSTGSTLGHASRRFFRSRLPVERASYKLERGQGRLVCICMWPRSAYPCGWSLNLILLRGFSGCRFLEVLLLLIMGFGYP